MRRALAVCALALSLGCGGGDSARYGVDVDRVVAADEPGLRAALATAVAASGELSIGGPAPLSLRASQVPRDDGDGSQLHVELDVPADLHKQFDVPAIRATTRVTTTIEAAADVAVRTLALRLRLARGHTDAAIGLLGVDDPETILLALEWTRDHPGAALADAVAARVDHDDPEVVILAMEVLALVGEARHASAVIRRVERWPALAREAYRTLGALGGADAVGFLQFAAANEDEAALQKEAERALTAALSGASERVAVRPHGVDLPRMARGHRQ